MTNHPNIPGWLLKRRRGSVAMEAVLAFPALLILFSAVSQIMILAQSRVYVEQAAYAAARSALVHKCPPFDPLAAFKSPVAAVRQFNCQDTPQKWEDAARWALVAAAPSSSFATARGQCPVLPASTQITAASPLTGSLQTAVTNRVCYAFEPDNVEVDVAWKPGSLPSLAGAHAVPIEATVRFKYPLTTPFRRFIHDGKRADGTYWRWGQATVVLL
ncbi:MAG: hypothetical protein AAGF74_11230 [Pseudomonadota bacterium]